MAEKIKPASPRSMKALHEGAEKYAVALRRLAAGGEPVSADTLAERKRCAAIARKIAEEIERGE
jgi:hypothetical protein